MILLVGVKEDKVMSYFRNYLNKVSIAYEFLDLSQMGSAIQLDSSGICFGREFYKYCEFTGVLNRMAGLSSADSQKYPKIATGMEWLCYALEHEFKNVANKLSVGAINNSKPYQLNYIRGLLPSPESYVFANTSIKLHNLNESGYIYKSISSIRSVVNKVVDIRRKARCPVLVQKLIQGNNIRVHVVGNDCFPLQVEAAAVDYRYDDSPVFSEIKLPSDIYNACVKIANIHEYIFTGIDLIHTADNEYYFLEANPSPGYSYFEGFMEKPKISEALANFLTR